MLKALAFIFALCSTCLSVWAGIFDIQNRAPERIVAVFDQTIPQIQSPPDSPMLGLLRGVIATLGDEEIQSLRVAAASAKPVPTISEPTRFAILQISGFKQSRTVELIRDGNGDFFAQELVAEGTSPKAVRLDRQRVTSLVEHWPRYRGTFTISDDHVLGEAFDLPHPYVASFHKVDKAALSQRLLRGKHTKIDPAIRRLEDEQFTLRLPSEFDPRIASGLLVWISAGSGRDIPPCFEKWLDERGFICIGAINIGNSRPSADRYQLSLDMVETVRARYLIDDTRVYVTGISGGGRVSSHVWMGWPEVFRGAAPIVGLGFYEPIPADKKKIYRPDYDKPLDTQFNMVLKHPISVMSGPADFNYPFIKPCVDLMRLHGFEARLFEDPQMGHTLPTPTLFHAAMEWVDSFAVAAQAAQLEPTRKLFRELPSEPTARKASLIQVTRDAPWTQESWQAVELLANSTDAKDVKDVKEVKDVKDLTPRPESP